MNEQFSELRPPIQENSMEEVPAGSGHRYQPTDGSRSRVIQEERRANIQRGGHGGMAPEHGL